MKKRLYKFLGIGFLLMAALPNEMACKGTQDDHQTAGYDKSEEIKKKETNEKDLDSPFWYILMK